MYCREISRYIETHVEDPLRNAPWFALSGALEEVSFLIEYLADPSQPLLKYV